MPQHLAALALVVRDYDEAIDWYTGVLGFTLVEDTDLTHADPPEPGKRWVRVKPPGANETAFLLARAATPSQQQAVGNQTGGRVFLFLQTDDFWRDHQRLTEAGVNFVRPPRDAAYGTVAAFADLYGNLWDLIGPRVSN
jgi:catechol 2,3-dioxygenase-like lactoylglutathione lyase family enzyme